MPTLNTLLKGDVEKEVQTDEDGLESPIQVIS